MSHINLAEHSTEAEIDAAERKAFEDVCNALGGEWPLDLEPKDAILRVLKAFQVARRALAKTLSFGEINIVVSAMWALEANAELDECSPRCAGAEPWLALIHAVRILDAQSAVEMTLDDTDGFSLYVSGLDRAIAEVKRRRRPTHSQKSAVSA